MTVAHLDHLNLTVRDLDETVAWYRRVFGFDVRETGTYKGAPWAILSSGEALLCLYEYPERELLDSAALTERRIHGLSHFGLRITDRAEWEAMLEREQIPVEYGGVVRWPHSDSWYVMDPTGYEIEVALWDGDQVAFD
jgi:lactoylglutathione lyase